MMETKDAAWLARGVPERWMFGIRDTDQIKSGDQRYIAPINEYSLTKILMDRHDKIVTSASRIAGA
jgi:hypothetical protein